MLTATHFAVTIDALGARVADTARRAAHARDPREQARLERAARHAQRAGLAILQAKGQEIAARALVLS